MVSIDPRRRQSTYSYTSRTEEPRLPPPSKRAGISAFGHSRSVTATRTCRIANLDKARRIARHSVALLRERLNDGRQSQVAWYQRRLIGQQLSGRRWVPMVDMTVTKVHGWHGDRVG